MKELSVHRPKTGALMHKPMDRFERKKFQNFSKSRFVGGGGWTVRVRSGSFGVCSALNKNAREKARTLKLLCITEGQ